MTWTKVSDDSTDRYWNLSDRAYRLLMSGKVLCNRAGSDGFIALDRLSSLLPRVGPAAISKTADELVAAGWWHEAEGGFHDVQFLVDQPSAEEVGAQREYDAIRQRIRYARGPSSHREKADRDAAVAALRIEEEAAKSALMGARDRRRAKASQREMPGPSHRENDPAYSGDPQAVHTPSHREAAGISHRPVPPRPAPNGGEGEDATSRAPKGAADPDSQGRSGRLTNGKAETPGDILRGLGERIGYDPETQKWVGPGAAEDRGSPEVSPADLRGTSGGVKP